MIKYNWQLTVAFDCQLIVPQWIMIRSDLFFSVGLIYDFISSFFAPEKDLTTNKPSLVDNSQLLTFFNYGVSNNHCNTATLFISFLSCFYVYVDLFMSLFLRFTCRDDMLAVTYEIICNYHYYICLYHFHLSHWELHICYQL